MPWGTLVNVLTVIVGSLLGLLLKHGMPPRIRGIVFQAIGLFTVIYGIQMTFKLAAGVQHVLALIFSLLLGGALGEWLRLEERLAQLGDWLKARAGALLLGGGNERFTEGLVTAFLIFCIGPLTIVGSLDDGLRHDHALLFTKATLDGFMSIALASTYGVGVLFSIVPLFIFQYAITLIGLAAGDIFNEVMVSQLTAVGGVLILGLGLNLLGLRVTGDAADGSACVPAGDPIPSGADGSVRDSGSTDSLSVSSEEGGQAVRPTGTAARPTGASTLPPGRLRVMNLLPALVIIVVLTWLLQLWMK